MTVMVNFTPVDLRDEAENTEKKMPLNKLIRSAAGRQESTRSAKLTLDKIRANLINDESVDEFEQAAQRQGIFGWLGRGRRRRRPATSTSNESESLAIFPASGAFATGQR
jgi:hypothetical protein